MGKEIVVNNLEEMCDLMCDNVIPDESGDWIPIKTRPATEEEKKYFEEYSDYVCEFMWDCPLPMDGQEVLITTKYGEVTTDTFLCDGSYGSYFETYSDDGDVLAWMPYPKKFQN